MSRSGNIRDNAAMESFFSSLKTERTARKTYRTRDEAKADVFDYIERFYNAKRRHSSSKRRLDYLKWVSIESAAGQDTPTLAGDNTQHSRSQYSYAWRFFLCERLSGTVAALLIRRASCLPAVRPVLSRRGVLPVTVARFKKPGLDLSGNALKPIFGAHGPVLKMTQLRLQLLDLVFGGSKLHRKAVCNTQCVATVLLRGGRRPLKQSHNGMSGFV
jgi:hypothetical protein